MIPPSIRTDLDPVFHEFASDWFATKRLEIEPNTASSYGNDLTNHLLPFFKDHHLSQITVTEVDRYRQSKVRQAAENKLRHTFASILVAIGKDPTSVMQQLGHTDPAFTLRVYSHMMRRSDEEREQLKALVEGRFLAGKRQGTRISASRGLPATASD